MDKALGVAMLRPVGGARLGNQGKGGRVTDGFNSQVDVESGPIEVVF
jgi:hypothetical protein